MDSVTEAGRLNTLAVAGRTVAEVALLPDCTREAGVEGEAFCVEERDAARGGVDGASVAGGFCGDVTRGVPAERCCELAGVRGGRADAGRTCTGQHPLRRG